MNTQITSPEQIALLRAGDIIKRFPSYNETTSSSDTTAQTDSFEIQFINPGNNMISLLMTNASRPAFSSPADISRLFIYAPLLISQKIWWV